jgi:hypothetical protein
MTYEEKITAFNKLSERDMFRDKSTSYDLPIEFVYGSSLGVGSEYTCNNVKLWCRFLTSDWFMPYGGFGKEQILAMINICTNNNQIVSLMELLTATKK